MDNPFYYDLIRSVIRPGTRISATERKKLAEGRLSCKSFCLTRDRCLEAPSLAVHIRQHWDKISEIPGDVIDVDDEEGDQATIDCLEGHEIHHIDSSGKRILTGRSPRVTIGWFPIEAVALFDLVDIRTGHEPALRIALSDAILKLAAQEKSRYQALLIHADGMVDKVYRYRQMELTVISADRPVTREVGFSFFVNLGLAVESVPLSPEPPLSEG